MPIGQGEGENKAMKAIDQALHHPLLESTSIDNAAGILVNFTCGGELSLLEVEAALTTCRLRQVEKLRLYWEWLMIQGYRIVLKLFW